MEKKEFMKKIYDAIKKELGEGYRLELKEVKKNNGVVMQGLAIYQGNRNVVPTIYLDGFREAYEGGQSLSAVVGQILKLYREAAPGRDFDMNFFQCFDKVKERICYRLIRREGNGELLAESPYIDFLDLALCFYYAYDGEGGRGVIRIKNSHVQRWGVKTADLVRLAGRNTPRLFGCRCISMEEMIKEDPDAEDAGNLLEEVLDGGFREFNPMMILTNVRRVFGAVCMLYPGVLENFCAKERKNLYILPSSVHEGATRFAV